MKTKFYFNTGVKQFSAKPPVKLSKGHIWRGGTMQIPFECKDVPQNAIFKFACDNNNLKEASYENYIVREIVSGDIISKYAYFIIPNLNLKD